MYKMPSSIFARRLVRSWLSTGVRIIGPTGGDTASPGLESI